MTTDGPLSATERLTRRERATVASKHGVVLLFYTLVPVETLQVNNSTVVAAPSVFPTSVTSSRLTALPDGRLTHHRLQERGGWRPSLGRHSNSSQMQSDDLVSSLFC